jgi:hypothetical protein
MTNTRKSFWVAFAFVMMTAPLALAKPVGQGTREPISPLPKAATLVADNVVVTPSGGQAAPAPAQPAQVNVQPSAPAAQPAPVVDASPRKTVHTDVSSPRNYMSTIAVSALMGGVAGALVGGAIYFLDDDRDNARNIGYWAAGGVLVGTGVGLTQVLVQENRASEATAMRRLPADPAPTARVALLRTRF